MNKSYSGLLHIKHPLQDLALLHPHLAQHHDLHADKVSNLFCISLKY